MTGSLKRKSDSNSANDEDGPSPPQLQPFRDHATALPTNPIEAGNNNRDTRKGIKFWFKLSSRFILLLLLCFPHFTSPTVPVAPPPASSSSSSPSPALSVSRGGCAQGERAPPPQAVVKPHVLTHLIEGFVIQEGAEPFPVSTWDL